MLRKGRTDYIINARWRLRLKRMCQITKNDSTIA